MLCHCFVVHFVVVVIVLVVCYLTVCCLFEFVGVGVVGFEVVV